MQTDHAPAQEQKHRANRVEGGVETRQPGHKPGKAALLRQIIEQNHQAQNHQGKGPYDSFGVPILRGGVGHDSKLNTAPSFVRRIGVFGNQGPRILHQTIGLVLENPAVKAPHPALTIHQQSQILLGNLTEHLLPIRGKDPEFPP